MLCLVGCSKWDVSRLERPAGAAAEPASCEDVPDDPVFPDDDDCSVRDSIEDLVIDRGREELVLPRDVEATGIARDTVDTMLCSPVSFSARPASLVSAGFFVAQTG